MVLGTRVFGEEHIGAVCLFCLYYFKNEGRVKGKRIGPVYINVVWAWYTQEWNWIGLGLEYAIWTKACLLI
jgi:hypothetical protein